MAAKRSAPSSPPSAAKRSRADVASSSFSTSSTSSSAVSSSQSLVARLPPALFARVLAFALPHFVPAANSAPESPNLPLRRLRTVAAVASDWKQATCVVVAEFVASTLDWRLVAAPTAEDVAQLRAELARRGERLLDLRLSVDAALRSKDLAAVDWRELLRLCPALQRLDLRGVPLEHSALAKILLAAAPACRRVEALVLSKRSAPSKTPKKAIAATYNALCEALEHWPALRQLSIPSRREDEAEAPSATLLAVVAELCPALEFLDGWQAGYRVDGFVECDEKWYVPPAVWTQFCASTMRALREFNWAVAPFHDAYFRIFAATPKPALRRLCLAVSESWSWEDFRLQGDSDDDDEEDDAKAELPDELVAPPTPDTLAAVVRALPHLEQLHVVLHANLDEPGTIEPEAFGDAFLASVADACPLLCELKIVELSTDEDARAIESLSGAGLLALSRMANLRRVLITGAGGASLDVFVFVEHWRRSKGQRTVDVGVEQGESERAFYDEALDLLAKVVGAFGSVVDDEEESASRPKFAVRLRNRTTAPDFKPKSLRTFCKALNKLVREIEATLPWVRVAVESDGVLEEGPVSALSTIGQVVVSSRDADVGVLDELQVLAPVASARASAKSSRAKPVDKHHSSSQEVSSSSESDDGSGYGSVADDASESSAFETDSDESDAASPTKPTRRRRASESDEVSEIDSSPAKASHAADTQRRASSDSEDEKHASLVESPETARGPSDSEADVEDSLLEDDSPAKPVGRHAPADSELSSVDESERSADDTNSSLDVVSIDSD